MATKHTTGPWIIYEGADAFGATPSTRLTVTTNAGTRSMAIAHVESGMPSSEANARLMAAAPEFYDAAIEVLRLCDYCFDAPDDCPNPGHVMLRDAVEKAERTSI